MVLKELLKTVFWPGLKGGKIISKEDKTNTSLGLL
jgi:hypothetical protein